MRNFIVLLFTFLFATTSYAGAPTFTWQTALCEKKGNYDPKKYTAEQLQNAYDLWFKYSGLGLETESNVFEPADIPQLSLAKLTEEYTKKKQLYNEMKVINTPFWQDLKARKMKELDDEFDLAKIDIQAYTDPGVLLNNRFTKSCPDVAKILASNDTAKILVLWKALAQVQSSKNGNPEKYMAQFNSKYNSDQKLSYARVELITFGWHNCANRDIKRVDNDGTGEREFNMIFTNVKSKCDEP